MAKKSINLRALNYDIGNFIELVLRAGYKRYRKNLLDLFDKLRITEMSKVEIRKKREREKERKREREKERKREREKGKSSKFMK